MSDEHTSGGGTGSTGGTGTGSPGVGGPDAAAGATGADAAGQGGGDADGGRRGTRERVSEGFQKGIGVLSAFKDALEETINEARERGDLSTDRAKEVLRGAVGRAREATSEARERFDFVHQQEFDELARRVAELERKVRERVGGSPSDGPGGPA